MDKRSKLKTRDERVPSADSSPRFERKAKVGSSKKPTRPLEKKTGLKAAVSSPLPGLSTDGKKPTENVRPNSTPTPLQNDPMFDDIDCDDFVGLTEYRAKREFAVTNESYLPLVDREYDLRAATDKRFSVVVSRSAFKYVMYRGLY
nr:uncharacterized protein LOC117229028 [Megalopta genalis]